MRVKVKSAARRVISLTNPQLQVAVGKRMFVAEPIELVLAIHPCPSMTKMQDAEDVGCMSN